MRSFYDAGELTGERTRELLHPDPFGAANSACTFESESCAAFPFLPAVEPGAFGKYYEFRAYWLKAGGLAATIYAWEAAMPGRSKRSVLTLNIYALDGTAHHTHLALEQPGRRIAIRAKSYARRSLAAEGR